MVTVAGPACKRCHELFEGRQFYTSFLFIHPHYCSIACLEATEAERAREVRKSIFRIQKYNKGQFWSVMDGNGELITVTVYKKGAMEVVRRLSQK